VGLLPVTDLLLNYRRFFGMMRQRWGKIPIVFLHFPVKLDKRDKFQLRYMYIRESITQVAQEFQPFHSLSVDESVVDWPDERSPGLENFPYHFHPRIYEVFAEMVRHTGVFERSECDISCQCEKSTCEISQSIYLK
jgi:hypothetical protein